MADLRSGGELVGDELGEVRQLRPERLGEGAERSDRLRRGNKKT